MNKEILMENTKKLRINMMSSSEKVAGQGVSGAYRELMRLLYRDASQELDILENDYRQTVDITHYHTIDPQFFATTFAKKRVGRKIGYVHFLPETLDGSLKIPKVFMPIAAKYVTSFYNAMDKLVVVNPSFIKDLVASGIPREKIAYIPNFVNKEKWYPLTPEERAVFRQEKGWRDSDLVVMGAGQVQKRKGIDDFAELARQNPDITFIWAGGFSFGAATSGYEEYKKLMKEPPHNLTFTGIISPDEMRQYYGAIDLFFLPSFSELFPMTILEAASCGAPIMLRDLELYEVILRGKYLPAKDFDAMSANLRQIMDNRQILNDLAVKSSEISRQYSEENLLKTWLQFYREQAEL